MEGRFITAQHQEAKKERETEWTVSLTSWRVQQRTETASKHIKDFRPRVPLKTSKNSDVFHRKSSAQEGPVKHIELHQREREEEEEERRETRRGRKNSSSMRKFYCSPPLSFFLSLFFLLSRSLSIPRPSGPVGQSISFRRTERHFWTGWERKSSQLWAGKMLLKILKCLFVHL